MSTYCIPENYLGHGDRAVRTIDAVTGLMETDNEQKYNIHRAYKLPLSGQSFLEQFLFFKIKKRSSSTEAVFVKGKLESCSASFFLLLQPPAASLVDKLSRV